MNTLELLARSNFDQKYSYDIVHIEIKILYSHQSL